MRCVRAPVTCGRPVSVAGTRTAVSQAARPLRVGASRWLSCWPDARMTRHLELKPASWREKVWGAFVVVVRTFAVRVRCPHRLHRSYCWSVQLSMLSGRHTGALLGSADDSKPLCDLAPAAQAVTAVACGGAHSPRVPHSGRRNGALWCSKRVCPLLRRGPRTSKWGRLSAACRPRVNRSAPSRRIWRSDRPSPTKNREAATRTQLSPSSTGRRWAGGARTFQRFAISCRETLRGPRPGTVTRFACSRGRRRVHGESGGTSLSWVATIISLERAAIRRRRDAEMRSMVTETSGTPPGGIMGSITQTW